MSKRNPKSRVREAKKLAAAQPIVHQPTLRALTIFDSLPPGHQTFLVTDDASAPHLRKGEHAVVHIVDRELQHGELYIVQNSSGERHRRITQARSDQLNITGPGAKPSLVWWLGDLRGWRKTNETVLDGIPVFAGLSDGPYRTEHLQPKLVGRIVGVALSPLDGLLAEAAGYENEVAGNLAFDPVEYVNVLISTGHKPHIYRSAYFEEMPHRALSDAEEKSVLAVRWKFCEAPTALERVKAECIRRGLTDNRRAA